MQLERGACLGHYEIVAPLGSGGMGDVYKAVDKRLDRTVALKILKGPFTDRFMREAKAISALNHPNICTLYDLGTQEDVSYLVMEHLEGAPPRGPLPWPEARTYAVQLLEALETAHRAGVVHRDVKPANIVLTKSGLKLLDFGLAKSRAVTLSPADATMTQEGAIQGTPHYMAPEQAAGGDADARADIFAFGAVLYELLTGSRAFQGDSAASVIGSVMKDDPLLRKALPPAIPEPVTRILARCLSKDRERRYQSARDVALDLEDVSQIEPARPVSRRYVLAGSAAAAAVAGAVATELFRSRQPRRQPALSLHFSIPMPDGHRLSSTTAPFSPDGTMVAFTTVEEGRGLRGFHWIRRLAESKPAQLAGLRQMESRSWAPDGRSLTVNSQDGVYRVNIESGSRELISAFVGGSSIVWCGSEHLAALRGGQVFRIPSAGGQPVPLGISNSGSLRELSGSTNFLMRRAINPERYDYLAAGIDGKVHGRILEGVNECRYGGGYLFFSDAEDHWRARAFDPLRVSFTGAAIHSVDIPRAASIRVSQNRDIAYVESGQWIENRLFTRGAVSSVPVDAGSHPEFSADAKRVLSLTADSNIWLLDLERGAKTRLTFDGGGVAVWSHDESKIYFSGRAGGIAGVYMVPAAGGRKPELLARCETHHLHASPDGAWIAASVPASGGFELIVIDTKSGKMRVLSDRPAFYDQPQFSPDSRWLAYASDETGRMESYIMPFPAGGAKWAISTEGGGLCRWRNDGRELYFAGGGRGVLSVEADLTGPQPRFGKPVPILEAGARIAGSGRYAATRDGRKFLLSVQQADARPPELRIITNWQPPSGASEV